MRDFRLASILLVPFGGGKISPEVRVKSFPTQDLLVSSGGSARWVRWSKRRAMHLDGGILLKQPSSIYIIARSTLELWMVIHYQKQVGVQYTTGTSSHEWQPATLAIIPTRWVRQILLVRKHQWEFQRVIIPKIGEDGWYFSNGWLKHHLVLYDLNSFQPIIWHWRSTKTIVQNSRNFAYVLVRVSRQLAQESDRRILRPIFVFDVAIHRPTTLDPQIFGVGFHLRVGTWMIQ